MVVLGTGFLMEAIGIALTMLSIFLIKLAVNGIKSSRAKKRTRRVR